MEYWEWYRARMDEEYAKREQEQIDAVFWELVTENF